MSLGALWALVVAYTALIFVDIVLPQSVPIPLLLLIVLAFLLLHGALRYRLSGIVIFIVIALVVSNILENVSILTGFPFGHYHYTDALGPKLFLVPVVIGVAYCTTGYLAWVLATVLFGEIRRASSALTTVGVPVIASFIMVAWDLCMDPTNSTIQHWWIWEQGGGYFGVPLTNYLGWFLTVYLFFQSFALYVRIRRAGSEEAVALPKSYSYQAIILYGVLGLTYVVGYLVGPATDRPVTDAVGTVWHTRSIYESAAIVSLYTMIFMAALSALKLAQRPAAH